MERGEGGPRVLDDERFERVQSQLLAGPIHDLGEAVGDQDQEVAGAELEMVPAMSVRRLAPQLHACPESAT